MLRKSLYSKSVAGSLTHFLNAHPSQRCKRAPQSSTGEVPLILRQVPAILINDSFAVRNKKKRVHPVDNANRHRLKEISGWTNSNSYLFPSCILCRTLAHAGVLKRQHSRIVRSISAKRLAGRIVRSISAKRLAGMTKLNSFAST